MTKDKDIKTVVPALRFPEFRDAEGWKETTLGAIASITNGKANAQDHIKSGKYPLFDRSDVIKSTDNYLFDCEAVIIPGEGMKFIPRYYVGKFNLHQRAYALKDFSCIGLYIYYLMEYHSDLLSVKAVKSTVLSLRLPILQNFPAQIPNNPKEQEKIAECLNSLDELIGAVRKKIEVLKDYKEGLMQQLFPVGGKTTPALRFPEFHSAPEWQEKTLKDISPSIFDGTHQTPSYTDEGVPFFSVENIVSKNKNKFISKEDYLIATNKNKPEKGDVLITRIGNIGFSAVVDWDYDFSIYVTLATIKQSSKFNSYYLHSYMQSVRYQKEIRSKSLLNAAPCKINMDELRNTVVLLPTDKEQKEQKKIAEVFIAIDNLITAQSDKLDQLKTHKKGLMQQLFPNIE